MKIENIAQSVLKKDDGIFYSKNSSMISYPEDGNQNCMQIEETSYWFEHRNNVIIEALKKQNNTSKLFFDIGGGNGFVSKRIQDEEMEVVLVEPGKNGAINAKKRNIDNVICSTLEDAGFKKSSFDSVGLFDVIEHIKNDVAFLKEVHAYLKDDGLVYITVPAYNLLWSNEDNDTGHYRRYTLKKLRRLMSEAGYKITYETYIFSILPIPIFLFRTIPSFLKLNKKSNELKKHQNEHRAKEGIFNKILNKIWYWEIERGKASKKIRFGGSCFIVAQKQ